MFEFLHNIFFVKYFFNVNSYLECNFLLTNFLPPNNSKKKLNIKRDSIKVCLWLFLFLTGGESSSTNSSCYGSTQNLATFRGTLKIVNPLGCVTTINDDSETHSIHNINQLHENCDETLFRPVVTVMSDTNNGGRESDVQNKEICNTNVLQNAKLIVPIYNENNIVKNKSNINKAKKADYKKQNIENVGNKRVSIDSVKLNETEKCRITENAATSSELDNEDKIKIRLSDGYNKNSYKIQEDLLKTDVKLLNSVTVEEQKSIEPKDDSIDNLNDTFSLDLKFPSLEPLENFTETYEKPNAGDAEDKPFDIAEAGVWNNFNHKKLIFAMCSSLKDDNSENQSLSVVVEPHESQDSDYKSLETEESVKINEVEVESPRSDDTTSSGSDDNTEENSGVLSDIGKQQEDDDEELRPLIKNSGRNEDSKHDETPSTDLSCNVNDTTSVQNTPTHTSNSKRKPRRKRK